MADRKARRWLKIGRKSAGLVAQFWMELNTFPNLDEIRPALRFGIRAGLLVLIVASAGVCVLAPAPDTWWATLLRMALALYMATQVPCPWVRWILVGDTRAKLNDAPGVERRVQ